MNKKELWLGSLMEIVRDEEFLRVKCENLTLELEDYQEPLKRLRYHFSACGLKFPSGEVDMNNLGEVEDLYKESYYCLYYFLKRKIVMEGKYVNNK